jgi:hypothetical protein
MDAVEFARSIRELARRAHGMPSDRTTREELIELRRRFLDALAAAPDGGLDLRRWIDRAVEALGVQTTSRRPTKRSGRYWAVGGTRRVRRSPMRLVEA